MKKAIIFLFFIIIAFSCKKAIEEIKKDAVVSALTDGKWKITRFKNGADDLTTNFSNYLFQYYSNFTVDAIKSGTVEKKGTWGGDAGSMTTWANFENVTNPLLLINGTWKIINNSWTYAELEQTNGTEKKTMRLEKQ